MKSSRALRAVLALALLIVGATAPPATADASAPAVRALLFFDEQCAGCEVLFGFLVPELKDSYGERLELAALDIARPGAAAIYRSAMGDDSTPDRRRLPVAVVGGRVLVGVDDIAMTLGDDFEALAASPDAARWPDLPGLAPLLAEAAASAKLHHQAVPEPGVAAAPEPADRDQIANGLAVVVLVGMVIASLHGLFRTFRVRSGRHRGAVTVPVLALIGIGISAYTAYASLAGVAPVCGPIGSCDLVQDSEYAKLFGIPMGVLGILGYTGLLATWLMARRFSPRGGGWRWLPWLIAFGGVLFSIRLTFLEPFVIGHTCLWCLASAVTMTTLFWLISGETRGPAGERGNP